MRASRRHASSFDKLRMRPRLAKKPVLTPNHNHNLILSLSKDEAAKTQQSEQTRGPRLLSFDAVTGCVTWQRARKDSK